MNKDLAWAQEMHNTFPPTFYNLTHDEIDLFLMAAEPYQDKISFAYNAIVTAYNYGFSRGRQCEKNAMKRKRAAAHK